MALTTEEATAYLAETGVETPSVLLTALLERANEIDACLTAKGYTPATAKLIQLYYLGLLTISAGGRRIASQSAPNGASRSYRYMDDLTFYRSLRQGLYSLDIHGCTNGLIPAEPGNNAALYVVTGRRCG